MSQIQNNAQKRELVEGRPRQVLSMADVAWKAVRFTDSAGYVDVCFAAIFGKDPQTGRPHVAVVNPRVLKEFLSIPDPHIRDGILAAHEKMQGPAAELPEGKVGTFEIGEVA